jgi:hypothetical protein
MGDGPELAAAAAGDAEASAAAASGVSGVLGICLLDLKICLILLIPFNKVYSTSHATPSSASFGCGARAFLFLPRFLLRKELECVGSRFLGIL